MASFWVFKKWKLPIMLIRDRVRLVRFTNIWSLLWFSLLLGLY